MKLTLKIFLFSGLVVQFGWQSNIGDLLLDYATLRHWNYITIVDSDVNALSEVQLLKIFQTLQGRSILSRYKLKSNSHIVPIQRYKDPNRPKQFAILWDKVMLEFLEMAGKDHLFASIQEWMIILTKNQTILELKQYLQDLPFYIDSEVIVSYYDGSSTKWKLSEIWRVGPGAPIQEAPLGEWSSARGFSLPELPHKYDRRKDMHGYHIRVSTIITMPYESLVANGTLQNFHSGYVVDLWHTFQEELNFTYSATDTLFGSLQKDKKTWNGMVGMLQMNKSDVAVAPLSITSSRKAAIDFTLPIQIVSSRLYIKRPVMEATWTLYAQPFSRDMWFCIPCSVIFTALSLWLLNKAASLCGCEADEFPLFKALWLMFKGTIQQSTTVEPKPFCAKIMLVVGYLSSLILYNVYAGLLVSILATMKPTIPFENFEGLRGRHDWNLGVRTNTALADALALAPKGTPERDAWEKNVLKDPTNNLPEYNIYGLKRILEGKYAFFANKEYIIYSLQYDLPQEEAMNIIDTGRDFLIRGIGFGVQKHSPFKKPFNYILTKLTGNGLIHRLKMKWWPKIDREPEHDYPAPGIKEVFTVILIFGIGSTMSVLFLILERMKKTENSAVENFEFHKTEPKQSAF